MPSSKANASSRSVLVRAVAQIEARLDTAYNRVAVLERMLIAHEMRLMNVEQPRAKDGSKLCRQWPRCHCTKQGYENPHERNGCGRKPKKGSVITVRGGPPPMTRRPTIFEQHEARGRERAKAEGRLR